MSTESIYIAGKVGHTDFRHRIVRDLRNSRFSDNLDPWETLEHSINDEHHYTGPFFIACDHGCGHADSAHGNGFESSCFESPTRQFVLDQCRQAIERSTFVYAWVDAEDAYGTLVEIGYAVGRGVPVIIASPHGRDYHPDTGFAGEGRHPSFLHHWWLALEIADNAFEYVDGPIEGLQRALEVRGHRLSVWQRLMDDPLGEDA